MDKEQEESYNAALVVQERIKKITDGTATHEDIEFVKEYINVTEEMLEAFNDAVKNATIS